MALFKRKPKEKDRPEMPKDKPIKEQAVLPSSRSVGISSGDARPTLPKGGDAHSYGVVLSPHVTEKGSLMGEHNKYIFKIAGSANKTEVKKAVESLYKVKVAKTHILYTQSKFRQVGKYQGRKAGFKKAIVTLRPGDKIDTAA